MKETIIEYLDSYSKPIDVLYEELRRFQVVTEFNLLNTARTASAIYAMTNNASALEIAKIAHRKYTDLHHRSCQWRENLQLDEPQKGND